MRRAPPHGAGGGGALCVVAAVLATLAGCAPSEPPRLNPLNQPTSLQAAEPRVSGVVAGTHPPLRTFEARGRPVGARTGAAAQIGTAKNGDVTLNFMDTDIREVARTILGTTLNLNYTIDPGVHGTTTFETNAPLPRSGLLPVLETLLNQNGATVVEHDGVYRVTPIATGQLTNVVTASDGGAGTQVIALHLSRRRIWQRFCNPMSPKAARSPPTRPATR